MTSSISLADYRLLGASGLRVSPLCLGTMTFGQQDWGMDGDASRTVFDAYVGAGGNFIDTADFYSEGRSEELIGDFAAGRRDRLVLATKYTLSSDPSDPNASGNHRKNLMRAVEASLKRLRTDYIDLYYLHVWDNTTPVEEIRRGFDDLVAQGKILYVGISDTPAWQVSRMTTLADLRGWSRPVALQIEYSLAQRTVERELTPMAKALGIGVIPWSPLAMGILSGKYSQETMKKDLAAASTGTREAMLMAGGRIDDRKLAIASAVSEVAAQIGAEPAQVAIAWLLGKPNVTAPIIGVRTMAQYQSNVGALGVTLDETQRAMLDKVSDIPRDFPQEMLESEWVVPRLYGENPVQRRR